MVSRLRFDGEFDADLSQYAAVASAGYRAFEQTTVQLSAGAVLGGRLSANATDHEVRPGFLLSAQVAQQWLDPGAPFLVTSFAFGYSSARTESPQGESSRLTASDLRFSLLAGYTVSEWLSPFALTRAFAGPVAWEDGGADRSGSDRNHYALGAGIVARASGARLTLSGSALGERSVSVGASYHF